MKIVGLITEYNPFHNGHLYHMKRAKEITGADYCVVLMSGSFVQRGEPAIFDKYCRTRAALLAGADLVFEMPVAFSTSSAHEFAAFGIALLSAIGADSVVFGSECGNIEKLRHAANELNHESPEFRAVLQKNLKNGLTYPKARAKAFTEILPYEDAEIDSILGSPNNILGIEYLRAAENLNSSIEFHTVFRCGSGYHDNELSDTAFSSAFAIRNLILGSFAENGDYQKILTANLPDVTLSAYNDVTPVFADDFSELLNAAILKLHYWAHQTDSSIADLSPELILRLTKQAYRPASFEDRIQELKTRQLTYTRVSRALMHLVLDITSEDIYKWKEEGYALYARILGFRREKSSLLSCLKKKSSIPLITKMADAAKILSPSALSMLNQEVYASHLYQTVRSKRISRFQNEYTEGLVII